MTDAVEVANALFGDMITDKHSVAFQIEAHREIAAEYIRKLAAANLTIEQDWREIDANVVETQAYLIKFKDVTCEAWWCEEAFHWVCCNGAFRRHPEAATHYRNLPTPPETANE